MQPAPERPALPSMSDRMYFADAMTELGIKDEQLRYIVSNGDIRAWRDPEKDGSIFFRKKDVHALKAQL